MRAIRLTAAGGPDALELEEIDVPEPGVGDALIRVHAAAITKDELEWPVDRLPAIPSYELSGEVAALGPDANHLTVGDEVYALADFGRDGAAADFAVVSAALLAPKPRTLDHVASAAIPLAALSAWQGLCDHGGLEEGQRVLILGATGGVGHFATQLARHRGAHVIATASDADAARALGAHQIVDYRRERVEDVVEPVDLVFDSAGGELLQRAPRVVKDGGRLVSVAVEPSAPGIYFVVEPNMGQLEEITRLVDEGALRPEIDSVYPLEEARAAFERSLQPGKRGKVVLRLT
jgi:NADPH:quinone reductase-like Zn-dependent oxidoreductase